MEITRSEVAIIAHTEKDASQLAVSELTALELALVGGGSADVHFG